MNKRIDFGFVLTQKTWALVGSPQSTQSAIGTWSVTSSSLSFKKHSLHSFLLPISSILSISFSREKKDKTMAEKFVVGGGEGGIMLLFLLCATFLGLSMVDAEEPYRFFDWNVTYGAIYPLGVH